MPNLSPLEALNRLKTAVEDAAVALQPCTDQPNIDYDRGRIDEGVRTLQVINARLDFLPSTSPAARELRLLRNSLMETR